jgi:phage recombination protein Bet
MTTTLSRTNGNNLAIGEEYGFEPSKVQLVKDLVAVGATDNELALFLYTAQRTGLDPLAKQIYCIKRQGKMTIQAGIDGYRLIADRTGKYAGNDDPVFGPDHAIGNNITGPSSATVTVWKMVGGVRCPFTSTARWSEYYPGDSQGFMWRKMPYLMLGKCAEALALRKAFPAELSGIYTDSEMDQAGPVDSAPPPPVEIIGLQPQPQHQQAINANLRRKAEITPSAAAAMFWERFEGVLGSREWSSVQRLLGGGDAYSVQPETVEGWRTCWRMVDAALAAELDNAA